MQATKLKNPSRLPGSFESRVFIGGSYATKRRRFLARLDDAVRQERFVPIVADQFEMARREIHDQTLYLLHSCRYAVFEASALSGALMEIERTRDYGTRTLVLWRPEPGADWMVSRMLDSFFKQEHGHCQQRSYFRAESAIEEVRRWLQVWRRHGDELHA